MSTLEAILDQLYFSAKDEWSKGDSFERLMLQFFRTDLTYVDRFSDVQLWMDWDGRHGRRDTGIDLVATERETGEVVAIQCKFYDPARTLAKADIDSFLSESGKHPFSQRIVVSTTDHWGKNAEQAIEDQQIPVQRLRFMDLAESSIDWSQFDLSTPEVMELKDKKHLRPHQLKALERVRDGLEAQDRGKLIMACGTGKTFTSLKIAEGLVGAGGTVLFLVPSIALLSQSLKEWSQEAAVDLRPFAVCSDTKVGRRTRTQADEDISVVDLALPATTNPDRLFSRLSDVNAGEGKLTVVFSTYQSIEVVAEAQRRGLADFDLVICDEAHRTTGATLAGAEESAFVRVHDDGFLRARKRLYMTATPRIYDDASKAKAGEAAAVLASMDDEVVYGPELHRLGFGEAVSADLLTDYKVLVLAVDERSVSKTFQAQMADENSELKLDDVAKIVGCWNGLAKRGELESGFAGDPAPMQRAVAFARSIKDSQRFAEMFRGIVSDYVTQTGITDGDPDTDDNPLLCDVEHVDGTFNILARNEKLDWLKGGVGERECRVLSNARCLSEGVDVPALDAVMFLNPRKSVVDVVQSVGRVMRKAPGKKYGYIILPVGIPADKKPEDALRDNERYAVVWEVLQALRAHDERFDAMVNKIDLNKSSDDRIQIIGIGGDPGEGDDDGVSRPKPVQGTLVFPDLGEWREAIYARIVAKVGNRRYWEDWAKDVARIADAHTTRITALLDDLNLPVHDEFDAFLAGLRGNLNDSITRGDAIDMLAQHLITRPVFDALFEDYAFTEHNPVSKVMQGMLDTLDAFNLEAENETLEKFYESVRLRAAGIDNAEGKQRIVAELYEKFFKTAFPRAAESLGIVYTPVEIVDFIIRSVDHLLREEFGASLSDDGVHILDPFTGTGTFIVRLLESGLIDPSALLRKYTSELHANEILLLAYYIAAINIEATFHGLLAEQTPDAAYVPFNGIVLTDTFQMTEDGDTLDTTVFPTNNERAANQLGLDIRVIIGNPPYSVGQGSANDNNANLKYPSLDDAIERTYARQSNAALKRNMYDSYVRAIRWASDRIKDAGVIGFVTNGGFLDSNSADGLRKTLAEEFSAIYVYNLRGNQRTAGELSRREGGKIFGGGSRNTVAVTFLVKHPDRAGAASIHYRDIGDYLSREQKLEVLAAADLALIDWQRIEPNETGDWINQRGGTFENFSAIGGSGVAIFRSAGPGLSTSRDAWLYGFSAQRVEGRATSMTASFNETIRRSKARIALGASTESVIREEVEVTQDAISWSRGLRARLARGKKLRTEGSPMVHSAYRPFNKQWLYLAPDLIEAFGSTARRMNPERGDNVAVTVMGASSSDPFAVLVTAQVPNLHFMNSGQVFLRWIYEPVEDDAETQGAFDLGDPDAVVVDGYRRIDNITDAALAEYRTKYGPDVSKEDIFYYVYGLLHSPDYRETFAADLKKTLPHIPNVAAVGDFRAFVAAGRELATLHIGYESVEPWPGLTVAGDPPSGPGAADLHDWYRVKKMRFGGKGRDKDRSTVIYNSRITVSGIPPEAHEYLLGSRSAVEWILERYQVKTDKASGIVNDPNDWSREVGDPRYILDLLCRIVTVSVETVRIVDSLPPIDFSQAT